MKKLIYKLVIAASILGGTTSCDSLDLSPEDFYGSGNYWKNEAHANSYLIGLHKQFRDNAGMFIHLGEKRGGTMMSSTSIYGTVLHDSDLILNNIDKDRTHVANFQNLYSTSILQLNHYIDQVSKASYLSEEKKNALLAPAYGMRAMYYFTLFRTFGGVPIITEPKVLNEKIDIKNFYIPRASSEETMAFIKSDINKSEEMYGTDAIRQTYNKVNWSKAATLMLKAEIYLWAAKVKLSDFEPKGESDLHVAKSALEGIMGKFSLEDKFADVHSTKNKENKEIIFAVRYADGEAGNSFQSYFVAYNLFLDVVYDKDGKLIKTDPFNLKGGSGPLFRQYKKELWASYDPEDTRRDATFYEAYKAQELGFENLGIIMCKFTGSINTTGNHVWDNDLVVYRYADALLMMAEVENGLGNSPADYINQVRKRAYGDNYAKHAYKGGDYAENELEILHERDKEFVAEGKRWFDLVRMRDANKESLAFSPKANYSDKKEPVLSLTEEKHKLLWPIDKNTLTLNSALNQTPGY